MSITGKSEGKSEGCWLQASIQPNGEPSLAVSIWSFSAGS
jgi:hypothetical protein